MHPVARYFPSAENFTQQTTLLPRGADVSDTEKLEGSLAFAPLVMKRVYKVYVECAFDLGVENGKPITSFFFKLGRNTEWVEFIQKAAILAYRCKGTVHRGALRDWFIG